MGIEMDFLSMWSQVTDEQIRKIQAEFLFDITLMIISVALLYLAITY
jgi:hypothetical protein